MSKFDLNRFKMGYFILYKRKKRDFIGSQIEKRQLAQGFIPEHACYTHIEVSGGGKHSVLIAPPRSKLIEITKKHKGREVCIVRYENEDYEKKGRYKVAYFSASLCNRGYDFFGIINFIFKWIKQWNRLWFCSEGATWSLQMEYPKAFNNAKPSSIMPAHYAFFPEVWKGTIPLT